jgi:polar amino acid transport system substrate-binding protein
MLVLAILSIGLASCSPAATATIAPAAVPATTEPAATTAPVEATAPAATTAPASGSANASVEGCLGSAETAIVDLNCREISIAVENAYPPFNYVSTTTGKPGGWDYDTFSEICTRLHCKPVFKEVAWESLIQSVSNKLEDIGGDGITVTDERKEVVDFSKGYIQIEQRLLVRKGETRFKTMDEFAKNDKYILGTQSGTTNYETAVTYLPESRIKAFEQIGFVVQSLINGDVDAVLMDQVVGLGYMGTNADKVELLTEPIISQDLAFAFAKGSDLVDPINQAIDAMKADGWLDTVNQKYFSPDFKVE